MNKAKECVVRESGADSATPVCCACTRSRIFQAFRYKFERSSRWTLILRILIFYWISGSEWPRDIILFSPQGCPFFFCFSDPWVGVTPAFRRRNSSRDLRTFVFYIFLWNFVRVWFWMFGSGSQRPRCFFYYFVFIFHDFQRPFRILLNAWCSRVSMTRTSLWSKLKNLSRSDFHKFFSIVLTPRIFSIVRLFRVEQSLLYNLFVGPCDPVRPSRCFFDKKIRRKS